MICFDIVRHALMSLDALMAYTSQAEDDTDSHMSDDHIPDFNQDLTLVQESLKRVQDNIRAAVRHRMNHPENDRLPDMLFWKGIEYEMVVSPNVYRAIIC